MTSDRRTSSAPSIDPELLLGCCPETTFQPGDVLRRKGQFYADMFLLTDGEVEVALDGNGASAPTIFARRGDPIGEIAFLTGVRATATVTARSPTKAINITDASWRVLEQKHPNEAVELYRTLSDVAEGRLSYNLQFTAEQAGAKRDAATEVVLCRTPQLLLEAQRIRYEIYCEELGRTSPFADHDKRIIADELDEHGYVLLAMENGAPIATLRMNMARNGSLGPLEELYGMAASPHHPQATGVCTKFIVRKSYRLGQVSFRLMATAIELAQQYEVKNCYIDCIPSLQPFYASLGFAQAGPAFLHRENGRSIPLMLDVDRYARRITRLTGFVLR
jgi:predicted GNAT family N-acyltransferase